MVYIISLNAPKSQKISWWDKFFAPDDPGCLAVLHFKGDGAGRHKLLVGLFPAGNLLEPVV